MGLCFSSKSVITELVPNLWVTFVTDKSMDAALTPLFQQQDEELQAEIDLSVVMYKLCFPICQLWKLQQG